MISPNGVEKTITINSYEKPRISTQWGGQSKLIDNGTPRYHDWEKELIIPSGWFVEIKKNN